MFRLTLAQMRRSIPRLVAAGLAIAIGTAFVAATLLAGGVMERTGRDAVTARYAEADVVVESGETVVTDADLAAVRALPDVAAAEVMTALAVELRTPSKNRWQTVLPTIDDQRLTPLRVAQGTAPAEGEIALPRRAAEALGVEVGAHLEAVWQEETADGTWVERSDDVAVVGLVDDPRGAWVDYGGAGLVTAADLARWNRVDSLTGTGDVTVLVAGAADVDAESLRDTIADTLPGTSTLTREQAATRQLERLGGNGDQVLVSVVLGFAAIALLVAALVIANTFQVLVAQRTRTLALLRCVGARRGQLRASVLTEAALLGLASSIAGLGAGVALAQGMLSVLRRTTIEAPLPATVAVTWQVIAFPLLVGTAVTLLASLVPARAATRVTAIEALRPLDAPTTATGAGATRLGFSIALTAIGAIGLAAAVLMAVNMPNLGMAAVGFGILAGAVSFVGVLLGAVFWLPPLVRLVQRALATLGPVPRLAAANTVRNPRRTAATSTALLIGVTLVALMSTGAASTRASLDRELDQQFPVDLTLTPAAWPAEPLPDGLAADVAAVDGVSHVATMQSVEAQFDDGQGGTVTMTVRSLAPDDAAAVLRDPAGPRLLADGAVLLPDWLDRLPSTVRVQETDADGSPAGDGVELRHETLTGLDDALVTPATMARLAPDAVADALYVAFTDDADEIEVFDAVQDTLGDAPLRVQSLGAMRAQYDRVIDVLLAVVVGLLGVAVVIALLGVANTLSLSVIERRRESATLRAIGLSRRGLRGALGIEGMLIAAIGAVFGSVLGVLYGWAGAATVLGQTGGLALAVPWRDLALVLVVALGAGLLASVVPARSAARTPPVAALTVE